MPCLTSFLPSNAVVDEESTVVVSRLGAQVALNAAAAATTVGSLWVAALELSACRVRAEQGGRSVQRMGHPQLPAVRAVARSCMHPSSMALKQRLQGVQLQTERRPGVHQEQKGAGSATHFSGHLHGGSRAGPCPKRRHTCHRCRCPSPVNRQACSRWASHLRQQGI